MIDSATELYQQFKTHPKVSQLPVQSVLDSANVEMEKLTDYKDAISLAGTPFSTETFTSNVLAMAADLGKSMDRVQRYMKGFLEVQRETRASKTVSKRESRIRDESFIWDKQIKTYICFVL